MTPEDITVVILAGGQGSRMSGLDKGWLNLEGQPLISHILNSLRRQSENIIINANRNLNQYAEYGYPVLKDSMTGFQGPLAGMLAAMSFVKTQYILTLPCDGPFIVNDYVNRMMKGLGENTRAVAVASDGHNIQPVYTLLPVNLKPDLESFLASGHRAIKYWLKQQELNIIEFTSQHDARMFVNVNTPQHLDKLNRNKDRADH